MGDPKKAKKKYKTPIHPWERTRLEDEKVLTKEFALKNKKELWKMNSVLSKFKSQAKYLITQTTEQSKKQEKLLLDKLVRMGFLKPNSNLDDVLGLTARDILRRRLQTLVYEKGMAKSTGQARQFIVHGHILVNKKKTDAPSYLVLQGEEHTIEFNPKSDLSRDEHPERIKKETKVNIKNAAEVKEREVEKKIEKHKKEEKEKKEEKPKREVKKKVEVKEE